MDAGGVGHRRLPGVERQAVGSTEQIRGAGLGLRKEHYAAILAERPAVGWFEALTENYLVAGGLPLLNLERIRADYPLVLHGVSLSIGGTAPLDRDYLRALRQLIVRSAPTWVSDHLCWTGTAAANLHDLMPLPFTETCLAHVAARVAEVQDTLGQRLLLENVSSYLACPQSTMRESEFLARLCRLTGCALLLDVNNVYVSAHNHGFDPLEYFADLPTDHVLQIHLAGHSQGDGLLIDTHDRAVSSGVWRLYEAAVERFGAVPSMIERDADIPPLTQLLDELAQVRAVLAAADARAPRCSLAALPA